MNEGKIAMPDYEIVAGYMKANGIAIGFLSEASQSRFGVDSVDNGRYVLITETEVKKGGAGFIVDTHRFPVSFEDKAVAPWSNASRSCSLAYLTGRYNVRLVSIYCAPGRGSTDLDDLLAKLGDCIADHACIVGGDFNAATGTERRKQLDEWMNINGLTLSSPLSLNTLREYSYSTAPGDLILLFKRGTRMGKLVRADEPPRNSTKKADGTVEEKKQIRHSRLTFILQSVYPAARQVTVVKRWLDWPDPDRLKTFQEHAVFDPGKHTWLDQALQAGVEAASALRKGPRQTPMSTRLRGVVKSLQKEIRENAEKSRSVEGDRRHFELVRAVKAIHAHAWSKHFNFKLQNERYTVQPGAEHYEHFKKMARSRGTTSFAGHTSAAMHNFLGWEFTKNKWEKPDWVLPSEVLAAMSEGPVPVPFLLSEVVAAIARLPNGKACGLDGLQHEALKFMPEVNLQQAVKEAANMYLTGKVRKVKARVVGISKGNGSTVDKLRYLNMLPLGRKLIEALVKGRILNLIHRKKLAPCWGPEQVAYQENSECLDLVFVYGTVIDDAIRTGKPLQIVSYDWKSAFNSPPKRYAAWCVATKLVKVDPYLARLVYNLIIAPSFGVIGGKQYTILCGMLQGSILAPFVWNCIMERVSVPLRSLGGYTLSPTIVLSHAIFADDLATIDEDFEVSQLKAVAIQEWTMLEWGGALNISKTQVLRINQSKSRYKGAKGVRFKFLKIGEELVATNARQIEVLGVLLTKKGLRSKHIPGKLKTFMGRMKGLAKLRGYTPHQLFGMFLAVCWSSVGYALEIILPKNIEEYAAAFMAVAKQVFCTYKRMHNCEVAREVGLLFHPTWLIAEKAMRYRISLYQRDKANSLAGRIATDYLSYQGLHPACLRFNTFLAGVGIDNAHRQAATSILSSVKILERLRGTFFKGARARLQGEAYRLGLLEQSDLRSLWCDSAIRMASPGYFKNPLCKNSLIIHSRSLGSLVFETLPCLFCDKPGSDHGSHLFLECQKVWWYVREFKLLKRSKVLSRLPEETQRRCLLLLEHELLRKDPKLQTDVFQLINKVLSLRRTKVKARHHRNSHRVQHVHSTAFLNPATPPILLPAELLEELRFRPSIESFEEPLAVHPDLARPSLERSLAKVRSEPNLVFDSQLTLEQCFLRLPNGIVPASVSDDMILRFGWVRLCFEGPIIVFTDGSADRNGKRYATASYAVYFPRQPDLNYAAPLLGENVSNNRAELMAVQCAIDIANLVDHDCRRELWIFSDSNLVVLSLTDWCKTWKSRGWRSKGGKWIENLDLIRPLFKTFQSRCNRNRVGLKHVYAHTGNQDWMSRCNEVVDRLASAAQKRRSPEEMAKIAKEDAEFAELKKKRKTQGGYQLDMRSLAAALISAEVITNEGSTQLIETIGQNLPPAGATEAQNLRSGNRISKRHRLPRKQSRGGREAARVLPEHMSGLLAAITEAGASEARESAVMQTVEATDLTSPKIRCSIKKTPGGPKKEARTRSARLRPGRPRSRFQKKLPTHRSELVQMELDGARGVWPTQGDDNSEYSEPEIQVAGDGRNELDWDYIYAKRHAHVSSWLARREAEQSSAEIRPDAECVSGDVTGGSAKRAYKRVRETSLQSDAAGRTSARNLDTGQPMRATVSLRAHHPV